jgi:hypothetical protein
MREFCGVRQDVDVVSNVLQLTKSFRRSSPEFLHREDGSCRRGCPRPASQSNQTMSRIFKNVERQKIDLLLGASSTVRNSGQKLREKLETQRHS